MTVFSLVLSRGLLAVLAFRLVRLHVQRRSSVRGAFVVKRLTGTHLVSILRAGATPPHRRSPNKLVLANLPRAVFHTGRSCSKWIGRCHLRQFLFGYCETPSIDLIQRAFTYLFTFLADHNSFTTNTRRGWGQSLRDRYGCVRHRHTKSGTPLADQYEL